MVKELVMFCKETLSNVHDFILNQLNSLLFCSLRAHADIYIHNNNNINLIDKLYV